jgi:multidrug efflux pump subunit AcrA (membrane-fusion protein)
LHTSVAGIWLARVMLLLIAIGLVVMFMPWQQNVEGFGEVTALTPQDRPQSLQNTIPGMIESWHVREGQFVRKNDTILTIREIKDDYFDPQILTRLQEQIDAKGQSIKATQDKANFYTQQIALLSQNRELSIQKARNKVKQARLKVTADSAELVAIRNDYRVATDRQERFKNMFRDGLISRTDFESRQLKFQETVAKVTSGESKLLVSRNELINSQVELNSVSVDYGEKIAKTSSERSASLKDLADAEGDLSVKQNKFSSVAVRRGYYSVVAQQDGYFVRAAKAGIGETIKEGETIGILQPATPSTAVALYVKAIDVPLLKVGRKVRLEFEGWPALQWAAGWPGSSVGTFGGTVQVIDYTDSKDGKYRILVSPDSTETNWPSQLRVGSQAYGWVMLENVPVWYEIWRQINAFPPKMPEEGGEKSKEKTAKK